MYMVVDIAKRPLQRTAPHAPPRAVRSRLGRGPELAPEQRRPRGNARGRPCCHARHAGFGSRWRHSSCEAATRVCAGRPGARRSAERGGAPRSFEGALRHFRGLAEEGNASAWRRPRRWHPVAIEASRRASKVAGGECRDQRHLRARCQQRRCRRRADRPAVTLERGCVAAGGPAAHHHGCQSKRLGRARRRGRVERVRGSRSRRPGAPIGSGVGRMVDQGARRQRLAPFPRA
mmetsp:Transcript_42414/g.123236  ORF Transcript_42414/g.123236 Transcript_42414/m.123236 type:complete len:233 (-) Transcript_42414:491-1189(-)